MPINLNDYSNIECLNSISCNSLFKAIDEKTKKEVIIESVISDTRFKDDTNDLIGGYNIINTLDLPTSLYWISLSTKKTRKIKSKISQYSC